MTTQDNQASVAREACQIAGRLMPDEVWAEARKRMMADMTGADFEDHLIRVAGEQAAILALSRPSEDIGDGVEIARLRSLCKANNDLARMNGADRARLMAENARLKDAIEYAQSEGFEWPSDPLPSPPDIDRSGIALEVSRADQLLADDLDYVAGKPVE